ncbi:MAG: hypothetical protein ABW096_05890 [Candidatus Thiodiazotropha sp.]
MTVEPPGEPIEAGEEDPRGYLALLLLNGLTLYLVMGVLMPNRQTADRLHPDVR